MPPPHICTVMGFMRKRAQPFLPGLSSECTNPSSRHGGGYSVGKRKRRRPMSYKRAMHIVMRASGALGFRSLRNPRNFNKALTLLKRYSKTMGVRIYRSAIVSTHIHIVLRVKNRESLQNFLRALAGNLACHVLRAKKGIPQGKFWDLLAFSRFIEWGSEFRTLIAYVLQNEREASGEIPYQTPKKSIRDTS